MKNKLYYDNGDLIIAQQRGDGADIYDKNDLPLQKIYSAHEIWIYDEIKSVFLGYKVRNMGTGRHAELLKQWASIHNINIICCEDKYAHPFFEKDTYSVSAYRFATKKDKFLFNLKF